MFGARSFEAGEDLVDSWLAKVGARAAQSAALASRLAALTATASSEGGRVSVTVDATGVMTGLTLDEAIRSQPAADTACEILATLQAAEVSLATQIDAASRESVLAAYPGRAAHDG